MVRIAETIGGLWELCLLGLRGGFRINSSSYWRWRHETAFGHDPARRPPLGRRVRAMLDYGRWVWRMKRRL